MNRLRWKSSGASGLFEVWRNTANNFATATKLVDGLAQTYYDDASATPGTSYYYWVRAVNSVGAGATVSIGPILTASTLPAPADVKCSMMSQFAIVVSWAAVTGATSYEIWRNTANDSATATLLHSGSTSSPYSDTSGSVDTPYFYWVKATDGTNYSDFSLAAIGVLTLDVPDTPSGIDASGTHGAGAIEISWSSAARAAAYLVYRSDDNIFSHASLLNVTAGLSYEDGDIDPATSYFYWVVAINYMGQASPAGWVSAADTMDPPSDVAATDDHWDEVVVTWGTVTGATGYTVLRNTVNNPATATILASGLSSGPFTDSSPPTDQTLYYWVVATRIGESTAAVLDTGYALASFNYSNSGTNVDLDDTVSCPPGTFAYNWDADVSIADRLVIYNNGTPIFDSGCFTGVQSGSLSSVAAGTLRFVVTHDCAGTGLSTDWNFSVTRTG